MREGPCTKHLTGTVSTNKHHWQTSFCTSKLTKGYSMQHQHDDTVFNALQQPIEKTCQVIWDALHDFGIGLGRCRPRCSQQIQIDSKGGGVEGLIVTRSNLSGHFKSLTLYRHYFLNFPRVVLVVPKWLCFGSFLPIDFFNLCLQKQEYKSTTNKPYNMIFVPCPHKQCQSMHCYECVHKHSFTIRIKLQLA